MDSGDEDAVTPPELLKASRKAKASLARKHGSTHSVHSSYSNSNSNEDDDDDDDDDDSSDDDSDSEDDSD